ncbi:MAG: hypothetical protein ACRDJE_05650 [Dehalococcoidia bacterium]
MTTEQATVLVLKDQSGDYFLLPEALLEQGRVPAEHTVEVEQLIADSDDVSGHIIALAVNLALRRPDLAQVVADAVNRARAMGLTP